MRIVVLFNLKPGVDAAAYEAWAASADIPIVNALASIDSFSVHAATGVLGSDAPSPYGYIEVVDIADMDQFGRDVAEETMQRVAAEFREFADNPTFILTRDIGAAA